MKIEIETKSSDKYNRKIGTILHYAWKRNASTVTQNPTRHKCASLHNHELFTL